MDPKEQINALRQQGRPQRPQGVQRPQRPQGMAQRPQRPQGIQRPQRGQARAPMQGNAPRGPQLPPGMAPGSKLLQGGLTATPEQWANTPQWAQEAAQWGNDQKARQYGSYGYVIPTEAENDIFYGMHDSSGEYTGPNETARTSAIYAAPMRQDWEDERWQSALGKGADQPGWGSDIANAQAIIKRYRSTAGDGEPLQTPEYLKAKATMDALRYGATAPGMRNRNNEPNAGG